MQCKQLLAHSIDTMDWSTFDYFTPQLLLLFASPEYFANSNLIDLIIERYPRATLVGCSTAGEIAFSSVYEKSICLTGIAFNQANFVSAAVQISNMQDSETAGQRLIQALGRSDLDNVIVFAPGVNINGSTLISGMSAMLAPGTRISGGLAGDNGAFTQTWTVHQHQLSNQQIVAVGFYGQTIQTYYGSYGGWQPFGPTRKVTRCVGNELFELDDEPALDIYKRYLGDYANQLPVSALLFPFEMLGSERNQTGLIRTILGVNHATGSLLLAGNIDPDGYLKLMHANTDTLIDGAALAASTLQNTQAVKPNITNLSLLISCVGRRLVMGTRVDEEVEAVARILGPLSTLTGFYSYGEISPLSNSPECKLHNQTMTITQLIEI